MKVLRWVVVLLILAYVAWIAVPGVRAFFDAPRPPDSNRSIAADPVDAMSAGVSPIPAASVQGEVAAEAVEAGDIPVVVLWGGAIGLYLFAAFLFANGNMRAMLAYLAAFAADLVLNFVSGGKMGSGLFSGVFEALAAGDLRYAVIGGAFLLGLFMLASGRPDRRRTA